MEDVQRAGSAGRSRIGKWMLAGSAALAVSGCVNPAFRESTATFGQLTKAAVEAQNTELAAYVAAQQERIRTQFAAERYDLRVPGDCASRLSVDLDVAARPCELQRRLDGRLVPVEQAPQYDDILALSGALSNYADSLAQLAGDFSESEKKFTEAVAGVATSIGGIERTIRTASGAPPVDRSAELGAIAGLVARLGNLYFAHERNRVLKQIIIHGDPFVQDAVGLLTNVDSQLRIADGNRLFADLANAQIEAARVIQANGTDTEVRSAQDRLFEQLAAYNRASADIRRFRAIGIAHARLREAAESGLSAAELREAIRALIDLAGATHQTVTTLRQENGSSNDAQNN